MVYNNKTIMPGPVPFVAFFFKAGWRLLAKLRKDLNQSNTCARIETLAQVLKPFEKKSIEDHFKSIFFTKELKRMCYILFCMVF